MESVLNQSFHDFEYIVIDDASEDETHEIICRHAFRDDRVRPIRNEERAGAAGALSIGLDIACGDYIAVMDADDIALPEKLARQVEFLDQHADYGAVGSAVRVIDANGNSVGKRQYPTHPAAAHWNLLFGTSILHSASMYRRSLIAQLGGYSLNHPLLCDYELFLRIAERQKIGNLPDELVCYRVHDGQASAVYHQAQNGQMLLLQFALQARWLGQRPHLDTWLALLRWIHGTPPIHAEAASEAMAVLDALFTSYCQQYALNDEALKRVALNCSRKWLRMAHASHQPHRDLSRACWEKARALNPALKPDSTLRSWLREGDRYT
jgi:hypothetical protein